jgi:MFS transporter, MHS family, proline/betaine transporter
MDFLQASGFSRCRVLAAGTAGNVVEWYDFALYGYLAPITAGLFFPSSDPLASLLNTYAVFALGFLTRPLGGLIFGPYWRSFRAAATDHALRRDDGGADLFNRHAAASVGILAPVLLAGLRLIQGISAGGEFSGSIILLVEHAPPNQRGLYGSIANFGAMIGALLGAGMGWLLTAFLPADVTYDWGWRVPFLTSIVIGALGLWIRLGIPDTPTYTSLKDNGTLERHPLRAALHRHGREMMLTAGLNWVVSAGYYVVFVWFVTDMTSVLGLPYHLALGIGTIGLLFGLIATPAFGYLSDRIGGRQMLAVGSVATAVFAIPLLMIASTGTVVAVTVVQLGLALLIAILRSVANSNENESHCQDRRSQTRIA